jgi:hypothetical protein
MTRSPRLMKAGYVLAGLVAGGVIAGAISAQAATPNPSPTTSTSTATADPHPGDNGADGVPEAQEQHGGHGGGLSLSGTVTAVGTNSVTIKTSAGTTTYSVTSSSDIDKNGEASLSKLAVGDAVTFGVDSTNAKQIDKLHAGDEAKNMPQHPDSSATGSTSG